MRIFHLLGQIGQRLEADEREEARKAPDNTPFQPTIVIGQIAVGS